MNLFLRAVVAEHAMTHKRQVDASGLGAKWGSVGSNLFFRDKMTLAELYLSYQLSIKIHI
jgi:hypothetical protein